LINAVAGFAALNPAEFTGNSPKSFHGRAAAGVVDFAGIPCSTDLGAVLLAMQKVEGSSPSAVREKAAQTQGFSWHLQL
jgi:hypothetical protein